MLPKTLLLQTGKMNFRQMQDLRTSTAMYFDENSPTLVRLLGVTVPTHGFCHAQPKTVGKDTRLRGFFFVFIVNSLQQGLE